LRDLLGRARAALDEERLADLSLPQLSRQLATSPRQLERAFGEIGETTFRAELTAARLRRAARMLNTRSLTIAQIARIVGYRQAPHFAKAFRAAFGMSPAEWRREVYGLGRPDPWRLPSRAPAEPDSYVEESPRSWAEEVLAEAERAGRTAWPRALDGPPDG
jgi:AraC family transcriptional regulator of adaptative response / methylphosphotriester-DNA alkyltransferase methyltransferase